MPTHNNNSYSDKIARLKRAINDEKAVLSVLVEEAMRKGEPINSPEILQQNAKVSEKIANYTRHLNGCAE